MIMLTSHWQISVLTSASAMPTASSIQDGNELHLTTSGYILPTPMPSLLVSSNQPSHTTSSLPAVVSEGAATTSSTLAPVPTDAANHSLSPTAQHVLISAATIGTILQVFMTPKIEILTQNQVLSSSSVLLYTVCYDFSRLTLSIDSADSLEEVMVLGDRAPTAELRITPHHIPP